jgi:hypothetical protein
MRLLVHLFALFSTVMAMARTPEHGFALEAPLTESVIRYKKYGNLIILSPRINDTLQVNLILDTGGRNIVLFGRRFLKCFPFYEPRPIRFSGLGEKKPISGQLALNNSVTLEGIIGNRMPVVVVPGRNIFAGIGTIDGVIGYDLLTRFELEINPAASTITFRCAAKSTPRKTLAVHSLNPDEMLPHISGNIQIAEGEKHLPLLVDTGSVLGLLYKSSEAPVGEEVVGMGYCGLLFGERAKCDRLNVNGVELAADVEMTITRHRRTDCLSIGMDFLKDYVFVINKVQGYFQLSRSPELVSPSFGLDGPIIARMY